MQHLIGEIDECIEKEYKRAAEKFGPRHASSHEAYAVILEEFEEAMEDIDAARKTINDMWYAVKKNEDILPAACMLGGIAKMAAAELVQVAAMTRKTEKGFRDEDQN